MEQYRAILFDVNGTLYRQRPLRKKILKDLLFTFLINLKKGYKP